MNVFSYEINIASSPVVTQQCEVTQKKTTKPAPSSSALKKGKH